MFHRPVELPGIEALHARFREHRYKRHFHDLLTVATVERGAATFELEGRRYVARAGTTFFIPPGAAHTGEAASRDGYAYLVLYLDPHLLETAPEPDAPVRAGTAVSRRSEVVLRAPRLRLLLRLAHVAIADRRLAPVRDERVTAVLAELAARAGRLPRAPTRQDGHVAVRRARELLHASPGAALPLAVLAERSHISRFHLVRVFREATGLSPHEYQTQLRVELAKARLREGESPARVATEVGFYDQAHLNRAFRRLVGIPPGAWAAARTTVSGTVSERRQDARAAAWRPHSRASRKGSTTRTFGDGDRGGS